MRTLLIIAALTLYYSTAAAADVPVGSRPPNIVLIVADNLGYGDIGCFGSKLHRTPHIDQMAAEGARFTHFYVTSGVCTPSRSSIVTGCYPRRVNLHTNESGGRVLQPVSPKGLHPEEITLAEAMRPLGYATACIGKWHLGDQPPFMPNAQGFDYYLGIPYSDDMTKREGQPWPELPLVLNGKVIDAPVDRDLLTRRYTEAAVEYIRAHRDEPFFLFMPQAMPGSTKAPFASDEFSGRSENGPYGDSVEELDWSAGQLVAELERLKLDEHTLVIWTSDNGAPRRNPPQGRNEPMGGWGYTTSEGGMRMPCVMWWPGKIPAGSECAELSTTMDFLPTFAYLGGGQAPSDWAIDGHNIWPLMAGEPGAKSPYEAFFYYQVGQLQAVRSGKWKLHLPLEERLFPSHAEPGLYDVVADPGETTDLSSQHPDVVAQLMKHAERAREDLGDNEQEGSGQRPAGWVENPQPVAAR